MANEWLRYANQGATRNQRLSPQLEQALGFAPKLGLQVEVFSGGQPSAGNGPRVGSVRHDHGGAADVFFMKDGRRLDWANPQDLPVFQDIVRQGKASGLTGFGAGPGYMQPGSMHVGFGSPGVWGAGGKGSAAPDWLREAFGAAKAATATPMMAQGVTPPTAGSPLASLYGEAPQQQTIAPPMIDGPPGIGSLALLFAQQQAAQQQRREDERVAEETRRAALFAPDSLATLYG